MAVRMRLLVGWTAGAALIVGCAGPAVGDGDSAPLPSRTPLVVDEPSVQPPRGRHDLSAEEQRAGDELAARIRPALEAVRRDGDLAPASTRKALLDLGIAGDALVVTEMRTPPGEATPPAGAVYAVRFDEVGCVIGDVRPERLLVEVIGLDPEFGCLEPFTH